MGVPTALGFVKVQAGEEGQEGPEVHEMELEDHVRIELPANSHITLGYFDEGFRDLYAQFVLAMLRGTDVPEEGFRLALRNNFRVNPLVNPQSHQYVIDLVHAHPLMPTGRLVNTLRARLQNAFMQALVEKQQDVLDHEERFKENLHLSLPSERTGTKPCQVERVCTTRPPDEVLGLAVLLGSHWAYLG